MKRLVSWVLLLVLALTMLPVGKVSAASREDIVVDGAEIHFHEDAQGNLVQIDVKITSPNYNVLAVPEYLPIVTDPSRGVHIHIDIPEDFVFLVVIPTEQTNEYAVLMEKQPDGSYKALPQMVTMDGGFVTQVMKDCVVVPADNRKTFPDVPDSLWAAREISYVSSRGIMQGKLNGNFDHGETISRKTVAMILYRIMGEPKVSGSVKFSDVKQDRYYNAILWANQVGIINGYNDGTFRPDDTLTRQHFAVMLYRFNQHLGMPMVAENNNRLTNFSDYSSIYSWARNAAHWAQATGIINGRANGTFDPQGNTSRAQLAVIMTRFMRKANEYNFFGYYEYAPVAGTPGKLDYEGISLRPGQGVGDDSLSAKEKQAAARVVAQQIADKLMADPSLKTDLDRISKAAAYVMDYAMAAEYTSDHPDYRTAYGLFVSGKITCAGNVRGLGLILECMGFQWEHINENQWTHQWCKVHNVDGMTAFADGSFYYGVAGYGARETDPWYFWDAQQGTSPYGFMER